jgi:hypothetical protein
MSKSGVWAVVVVAEVDAYMMLCSNTVLSSGNIDTHLWPITVSPYLRLTALARERDCSAYCGRSSSASTQANEPPGCVYNGLGCWARWFPFDQVLGEMQEKTSAAKIEGKKRKALTTSTIAVILF